MEKTKKIISDIVTGVLCVVTIWIIASFFNINATNMPGDEREPWKLNFFTIFTEVYGGSVEEETTEEDNKVYSYETEIIDTAIVTTAMSSTLEEVKVLDVSTTIQKKSPEEQIADAKNDENSELYMLAHIIFAEAGSNWCSDTMQLYTGSVILNRIASANFPNTMRGVIFQKGQYACTWDGNYAKEPDERAWKHAQYLLENGSVLPTNVVFQAEFTQGSRIYEKVQNMYFCYN